MEYKLRSHCTSETKINTTTQTFLSLFVQKRMVPICLRVHTYDVQYTFQFIKIILIKNNMGQRS